LFRLPDRGNLCGRGVSADRIVAAALVSIGHDHHENLSDIPQESN
jgi:hypothetical protein